MVVIYAESSQSFVANLARWLAPPKEPAAEGEAPKPSALEAEYAALEKGGKVQELADKLRVALLAQLGVAKETDVRNAFGLFLELLSRWQLLASSAEALATELVASTEQQPEVRRGLLFALYSAVQQHGTLELRFSLLVKLIPYCAATDGLSKALGPAGAGRIQRVERWVSEWELSTAQQTQLWALVLDAHADDDAVLHEAALKYFALHAASTVSKDAALKERIVKAVLVTIRSPQLFRSDELSQCAVVQQLSSDATYAPLHALLGIMARDTYSEFLAFTETKANVSFMSKHELPLDSCGDKMRLLTLVSLGHANKELPYGAIAAALRVEASAVETWVMRGIGAGLITAKMDQVREVVSVSSVAERDFGPKQWERLHASLLEWSESIHGLLDVLAKARPAPVS